MSVLVEYNLQGMLAQFSRTSLVQELGKRLVAEFAGNLNRHFGGAGADAWRSDARAVESRQPPLAGFARTAAQAIWSRLTPVNARVSVDARNNI